MFGGPLELEVHVLMRWRGLRQGGVENVLVRASKVLCGECVCVLSVLFRGHAVTGAVTAVAMLGSRALAPTGRP